MACALSAAARSGAATYLRKEEADVRLGDRFARPVQLVRPSPWPDVVKHTRSTQGPPDPPDTVRREGELDSCPARPSIIAGSRSMRRGQPRRAGRDRATR